MNKNIKASIAIAAGVVLLMGGAGSLAFWNDTANVGPATGSNSITAGNLKVEAVNNGTWTKGFYNAVGTVVTAPAEVSPLSSVVLVPGNRLVYTQVFNVTATGEDLRFSIAASAGSVTAAATGNSAANDALAAQLALTSAPVATGGNLAVVSPGVYKVTAAGTSTVTISWTIDFPYGSSAINTAKLGAVSLSQGSITLAQVAAP